MKCRHSILEIPYSTNFITTTIVNIEPVFNNEPQVESLIITINYCRNKYQVQNHLGQITEINLGNGIKTTFGYWGVGGTYDNSGGYYGRLWEIKTSKQPGSSPVLQDIQHTWDNGGNLTQRRDVLTSENETFNYDFLDRLTSVSGPYTETFTYDQIGNITSKNGASYSYGAKPHAVTAVGATNYAYDTNGNMTNRGGQVLTWDVENRPLSVSENGTTSIFVYDGNGNRVKKTEGGQTVIYVNGFYEKNITTSEVTTNYLLGGRLIAQRKGTSLQYMHQDHLGSTSVTTDSAGGQTSTIKYFPFGGIRSGTASTDVGFTGQRTDTTGLYYYGARYYDPVIGRFISADTVVSNPWNPQSFNRYAYCLNNPLKYIDPTGYNTTIYNDPWGNEMRYDYELDENGEIVTGSAVMYNGSRDSYNTTTSILAVLGSNATYSEKQEAITKLLTPVEKKEQEHGTRLYDSPGKKSGPTAAPLSMMEKIYKSIFGPKELKWEAAAPKELRWEAAPAQEQLTVKENNPDKDWGNFQVAIGSVLIILGGVVIVASTADFEVTGAIGAIIIGMGAYYGAEGCRRAGYYDAIPFFEGFHAPHR